MAWTCEYLAVCKNPDWNFDHSKPCCIVSVVSCKAVNQKESNEMPRWKQSPTIWVYAHAAPLDGDHTTALSGTLWRYTLRWLLPRARISMKSHCRRLQYPLHCRPRLANGMVNASAATVWFNTGETMIAWVSATSQLKVGAGTSEWPTPISPDQMGVFVGSGRK